jgi:hypothetical protein
MLADIMRSKPNFGGDIFKGPVYQSQFKKWNQFNKINKYIKCLFIKTFLFWILFLNTKINKITNIDKINL